MSLSKSLKINMNVPTLKELKEKGVEPEILFWVGCAGSFDDRAKKITKSFVRLLNKANVSYGVLGVEESCTGDPAKRACLLYTSPSPRDGCRSRMPSSA